MFIARSCNAEPITTQALYFLRTQLLCLPHTLDASAQRDAMRYHSSILTQERWRYNLPIRNLTGSFGEDVRMLCEL